MKKLFLCLILAGAIFSLTAYAAIDLEGLMDNFQKATDLQRQAIVKDNLNKEVSASGKVNNVGEYDFFDIVNDIKGIYYQVSLEQQKTKANTPYQVIFLFKDRDKVKDLDKGQNFQKDGQVIRILDERLQLSVWLF